MDIGSTRFVVDNVTSGIRVRVAKASGARRQVFHVPAGRVPEFVRIIEATAADRTDWLQRKLDALGAHDDEEEEDGDRS